MIQNNKIRAFNCATYFWSSSKSIFIHNDKKQKTNKHQNKYNTSYSKGMLIIKCTKSKLAVTFPLTIYSVEGKKMTSSRSDTEALWEQISNLNGSRTSPIVNINRGYMGQKRRLKSGQNILIYRKYFSQKQRSKKAIYHCNFMEQITNTDLFASQLQLQWLSTRLVCYWSTSLEGANAWLAETHHCMYEMDILTIMLPIRLSGLGIKQLLPSGHLWFISSLCTYCPPTPSTLQSRTNKMVR